MKGRPLGSKNKPKAKPKELYDDDVVKWAKAETLRLFDAGEIDDLSEASEKVGVSKLTLYSWRKGDKTWRNSLDQAMQPMVDRLLREIMVDTMPDGKTVNMPYITARLFVIKRYRPEFREAYRFVMEDSRVMEHLEALKKLATQSKKEKPAE